MRRLHLALFAVLITLGTTPLIAATSASVTGFVRDSTGVPQMGAVVQLLRPDLTMVASVYTDSKGRFSFSTLSPGHYAVKAMGTSFLPSLRENVRVRSNTIVNLTLNTLYEVMQWMPAEPRAGNAQKDDWAWTLRSAANRPLLRWLEDGPLVVVSDGSGAAPKLKARLMATGQEGTFGENGERISASIENTPSDSSELLARVDFEPGTDGGLESMLGFRQELGFAGSVQSVGAVAIHPEIEGTGSRGLNEASVRSWETINMGDEFQVEAGAEQVLARFAQDSSNTILASLPFVSVGWRRDENSTFSYRMATSVPGIQSERESRPALSMPALSVRDGNLALERGLHQELGWQRKTDASTLAVLLYADSLNNPVIEAMGHMAAGGSGQFAGTALYDRSSGLMRAAGPHFSTAGIVATAEHHLGGNNIRLTYANGDALVMQRTNKLTPLPLSQVLALAHPRRAQTYSISLSGTLDGSGTRWRASYRWQPEETVTRVAPFGMDAAEPFFNVHLRQPVSRRRDGAKGVDAMVDVRNLLAEGYRPFLLSDGSILMFAQDQRSISAGLAFTF